MTINSKKTNELLLSTLGLGAFLPRSRRDWQDLSKSRRDPGEIYSILSRLLRSRRDYRDLAMMFARI